MDLSNIKSRDVAMDLLEGYSHDRKTDLDANRARKPLVKSYLLEDPAVSTDKDFTSIFRHAGHEIFRIDDTLFKVRDGRTKQYIALVERLLPRYPVIYSHEDVKVIDRWVKRLVHSSFHLDHLWISGYAFERLLDWNFHHKPPHRYGRLVFQHTSVFESETPHERLGVEDMPEDDTATETDGAPVVAEDADEYVPERRATRFTLVDKLSVLRAKLPTMRDIYQPLHVISQLRFPATGSGGHDFYFNGKATNRSASFSDHRAHVKFVLETYQNSITKTEAEAWSEEETAFNVTGAPVVLRFHEPLTQETFDTFIAATFRRKQNRFGLWGDPIWLGPSKVHVYALDRHMWQQLFVEITRERMIVLIPRGTCGNSIHRLVTNVQQFLDPAVDVHIGGQPYPYFVDVPAGTAP